MAEVDDCWQSFRLADVDVAYATSALIAARDDTYVWSLVSRIARDIAAGVGLPGYPQPSWPDPYPKVRVHEDGEDALHAYFELVVFSQCLAPLLSYYDDVRAPAEVISATLADVGRSVHESRAILGRPRLRDREWLSMHLRGILFELGRLQYERIALADERMHESCPFEGEYALDLHIPSSGRLTAAAVDASLRQAARFFVERFAEEAPTVLRCSSWLLDPQWRDFLPEHSNIVQFQKRFALSYLGADPDNVNVIQYVFKRRSSDLEGITPSNTLERAVVDHIERGGQWQVGLGWMRLDFA